MSFLIWLEQTAPSVWIREAPTLFAFPFILFLHTLGLALLAGISVAIDLWLLSGTAQQRIVQMANFFRLMWLGFGINAVSGVALLIAYPAKALTDPVFYTKMVLVVLALVIIERLKTEAFAGLRAGQPVAVTRNVRRLAAASLVIWGGTILAGRLLAYTARMLLATDSF